MNKKQLRQDMREKLSTIQKPMYEDKSYKIAQKLYEEPSWTKAETVGITLSNPPEVDTYQIIRKAWELGKTVVVPKCISKTKKLDFRCLEDFSQIESVFFGLYEPIESITRKVNDADIDLLIVPGLIFTRKGFRVGFGGGYYDRFLTAYRGDKISLAFENQVVTELPIEEHDIPVDKIITNNEVIVTNV